MATTSTLQEKTTKAAQNKEPSDMEICADAPNLILTIRDYIKSLKSSLIMTDKLPKDFIDPVVTRPKDIMSFSDASCNCLKK